MPDNVLVVVVFFLMVFMLGIQVQLSDLNTKLQETIKKVDELLKEKERLKEKSNPTIQNMQF
jgi:predicted nuclease with TOPRIM domain